MILLFDREDREAEIDLVMAADRIRPQDIYVMRRDGGGLICVCVDPEVAAKLELPFLTDLYRRSWADFPVLRDLEAHDIPYGERSSFSLSINHRHTFTGITDHDRALTIQEFAKLADQVHNGMSPEVAKRLFGESFRSPGHTFLLRGLLHKRKGHTELSLALIRMTNLVPITVICEMMDGSTSNALSFEKASEYAKQHNLPIISGQTVIDAFMLNPNKLI
jgi:3,4-dihydroxy 2-butanone 4-phosphate synthase